MKGELPLGLVRHQETGKVCWPVVLDHGLGIATLLLREHRQGNLDGDAIAHAALSGDYSLTQLCAALAQAILALDDLARGCEDWLGQEFEPSPIRTSLNTPAIRDAMDRATESLLVDLYVTRPRASDVLLIPLGLFPYDLVEAWFALLELTTLEAEAALDHLQMRVLLEQLSGLPYQVRGGDL